MKWKVIGGVSAALAGCAAHASAPLPYQVSCILLPSQQIMVASSAAGIARAVMAQRGDFVRKGQVLMRVGSEMELAQERVSATKADAARRKLARYAEAIEKHLISDLERDQLRAEAQLAEQEYQMAHRAVLQKTTLSPISGVIANRKVEPGQYVGTEPVFEVSALNPLRVELVFKGQAFGSIRLGSKVNIMLGGPVNAIRQGVVTIVDRTIDARSGTFGARVSLPNPGLQIPSGIQCKAAS